MSLVRSMSLCTPTMLTLHHRWRLDKLVLEDVSNHDSCRIANTYKQLRFEVQMGIIAACVPTLHHGWKWLRRRFGQRKPHDKLTDEVQLWPYDSKVPANASMVSATKHSGSVGNEVSHVLPNPSHIQKTTRVDVDLEHGQ